MRSIHSPLLNKYTYHLNQLCSLTITQQQQEDITQFLYYILSYMSRTSKVFLNYKATQQNGCVSCYVEALPVILQGLELPAVLRDKVQSGIRQYLHRGIICLGDELLDYVPLAVSLMLKDAELSDIQELIPLINQLITKYKSRIAPFIQEVFMFVIQTITSCTSQPYDPLDVEECRDRMNLQKSYYLFINSLCINGVTEVIYNLGSEQLYEVLQTVIDGARTSSDPSVKKICIMSLKRLVEIWGVSGCVDGFMDFCYKEVLPVCFHVPLQRHFDVNEAQSFLCLGEIAGLLKGLVNCGGNEFLLYLQNHYLISLNIHLNLIQELLVKLQEVDTKSLKPYLKVTRFIL
jgi:exportin-T